MKAKFDHINSLRLIMRPSLVYLISSLGEQDDKATCINLAPYSLVMEASHKPPRILVAIRQDNDTYTNIQRNKEFVLNACSPKFLSSVITCSHKIDKSISEIDYLRVKTGISLTPFRVSSIESDVPGILELPVNIWCRLVDGMELNYDERCYQKKTTRSVMLAEVLGITANDEYIQPFEGQALDKLNPEKPLLLSYGAGAYGKTSTLKLETDKEYPNILKKISEKNEVNIPRDEKRYSSISKDSLIKKIDI